jgi:hypothetical protein
LGGCTGERSEHAGGEDRVRGGEEAEDLREERLVSSLRLLYANCTCYLDIGSYNYPV